MNRGHGVPGQEGDQGMAALMDGGDGEAADPPKPGDEHSAERGGEGGGEHGRLADRPPAEAVGDGQRHRSRSGPVVCEALIGTKASGGSGEVMARSVKRIPVTSHLQVVPVPPSRLNPPGMLVGSAGPLSPDSARRQWDLTGPDRYDFKHEPAWDAGWRLKSPADSRTSGQKVEPMLS
jgi:hypothetical protein